jgi:hypothetical protein
MPSPPVAPAPPALVAVDPNAAEQAVAILRQAADAAHFERERQQRAMAQATEAWLGRERARAERDAASLQRGWLDLEVDLRRAATLIRLAVDDALVENRRRQTVYDDALAEYREARAALARTQATSGN